MKKYNSRKDVPKDYKWDLSEYFQNESEYEKTYKSCEEKIKLIPNYHGCSKDSKHLLEYLEFDINLESDLLDLEVYAYLINDENLTNSSSALRLGKIVNLVSEYVKQNTFFVPELLSLSEEKYNALFNENPSLNEWKFYLDCIFRNKAHTLSASEEKIIASLVMASDHYDEMSSVMLNGEHNYGKVKLKDNTSVDIASNNYRKLMKDKDVNIRKKVYNSYNKKLDEYSVSNASFLNGYVALNNEVAKIRKFNSAWEAKLFNLNLTNDVYKSLVETTEENINVYQKYWKLYKKVLDLPKLNSYDLSLELSNNAKEYTIEMAQDTVLKAVSPLGKDYLKHIRKVFDNHYIDYCQYKGKCSGGYSMSSMKHASRILMSFNYDLTSISTIAHEAGHNVHHQYISENNTLQYRDVSTLVAEVASLTNEFLLSDYIYKNGKTKEEKLAGLENAIDVIMSNLFGAVREGKMEQDFNDYYLEGNPLTKDYLDKLTNDSKQKYMGKDFNQDKYTKNSWVTRSHYYMNFYLYSYSICVSVASYVADKIINGDDAFCKKYLEFLSLGGNIWPIDAFKFLGIDITKKEVYENAIKYFDKLLDEYEMIYDEGDK